MSDSESESDSDKIRRTKRSVVVKFELDDTSSDDSDVAGPSQRAARGKRGRKKIPSSTEESSSDSDLSLSLAQRRRGKKSRGNICEDESDASTDDSWSPMKSRQNSSDAVGQASTSNEAKVMSDSQNSSDTDSSCDLVEKCPICLHSFREQAIGIPTVCEHNFCATCIEEWASNVQTCPIDRKPFTKIRICSRHTDGVVLREVEVRSRTAEPQVEFDFTNCEVCNRSDREEVMLLCDGCNAGYHMDCLVPALTEVPEGSWYCDYCFRSDTSSEDDINEIIAELDTMEMPATRLRVRREIVPRIPRTRQSERIRATIRNRRRDNQSDVATVLDISMPGASNDRNSSQTITTTTTTTTTMTTTKTRAKVARKKVQKTRKRRRKVNRKRSRTYVVEYDVDNYDHKFSIKTAKRVIRRRRRKAKSRKKPRAKCTARRQNSSQNNAVAGNDFVMSSSKDGLRQHYPKLHLFGNKNELEYFSDGSDNDEGIASLNNSMETGDGMLIMSSARSSGGRNLLRRKNIAAATITSDPAADVLSSILGTMDRWHSMSRPSAIEKIKINSDGSLEMTEKPKKSPTSTDLTNTSDILNAPMYPRNGGGNNFNNSNGFRGGNSNQNNDNYSYNRFSGGGGGGGGNGGQMSNPFQRGAGNFNQNRFENTDFPRNDLAQRNFNRTPNQRQRNNPNSNRGFFRNQFQSPFQQQQRQQGLYDGEDIAPTPDEINNVQIENASNNTAPIKEVQQNSESANDSELNQNVLNQPSEQTSNPICSSDNQHELSNQSSAIGEQSQNESPINYSINAPINDPPATSSNLSANSNDCSDSDEADDCPVFEYSAESMQVAKESKDAEEEHHIDSDQVHEETLENDEDLVQLDDDENFANDVDENAEPRKLDDDKSIASPSEASEIANDENFDSQTTTNTSFEQKDAQSEKCNADHHQENSTEDISEPDEGSYTPCLDEQMNADESKRDGGSADNAEAKQRSTAAGGDRSENASINTGIEGMDTEMISEDDDNENILHNDQVSKELKADKENNNRKSDRDDSFKKVSKNTKERNYREKKEEKTESRQRSRRSRSRTKSSSRSKSRSRNRSRSRDRHRRDRHRRNKRQDIQRYDVRNLIADRQPRTYKDRYGRQLRTRSRSISPRQRSRSIERSVSQVQTRRRSLSRRRRSRSISHNRRKSRSISRRRSRSPSRRRRSISHTRRRVSRSPIRRISRSPHYAAQYASSRSRTPPPRGRIINGQRSRSRSARLRRSLSKSRSVSMPRGGRSRLMISQSRSRSRSNAKNKSKKKPTDKKSSKYRSKKKASGSKRVSPFHSPSRRGLSPVDGRKSRSSRSKSWNHRAASWDRSLSDVPPNEAETSWTPPIAHAPENLTVILKNKDSKRKRDKKRKTEKRKTDSQKKEKRKQRSDKQNTPALPSKEVFASGDNILVSVSFNKEKQQQTQQTTIVTLPPTKEQILSKKPSDRDATKRSRRATNRNGPRKHKKVDIKPVAIIDLDNSPFKEVTPSPRAVIILSDSDHDNDKSNKNQSLNYSMVSNATESVANDACDDDQETTNIRVSSPPQSPTAESASYEMSLGPKTPPEPHLVKFSISTNTKTKIRTVVNPLHDDNDDDDDENEENKEPIGSENAIADKTQTISNVQNQPKVGPNTPPDSGPCSPDVYDPFEPTKSPSQSPLHSMTATDDDQQSKNADDSSKAVKPVDLKMALINSKASTDAASLMLSSTLEGETAKNDISIDESNVSPYKEKPIEEAPAPKPSGIHVFSNVLLTPAKATTTQQSQSRTTLSTSVSSSKATISGTTPSKQPLKYTTGSLISKLPMPPKVSKPTRHNGNDDNMDIESPYSPGSSDYEDWFEPPQASPQAGATGGHSKKHSNRPSTSGTTNAKSINPTKVDIFDDLFGSTSPVNKKAATKRSRPSSKRTSAIKEWIAVSKHSTQPPYGKLNEEQLRILDDVPGSAVELQAKDKFLRKLNRQERVIEEVKLVLKPHYNKKHISKDDYKDIMRRAVPKICHNRTGEINPKKIKRLIEAYVMKFRQKRKQSTSAVK